MGLAKFWIKTVISFKIFFIYTAVGLYYTETVPQSSQEIAHKICDRIEMLSRQTCAMTQRKVKIYIL